MSSINDKLYRSSDGHAWVGENISPRYPQHASYTADLPAVDDSRWIAGVPQVVDVEFLTLSPFSPSGRLGCCVEIKRSNSIGRYPNHPAFAGCQAWMPLDAIDWQPVPICCSN